MKTKTNIKAAGGGGCSCGGPLLGIGLFVAIGVGIFI
jgi:hypothetical protein